MPSPTVTSKPTDTCTPVPATATQEPMPASVAEGSRIAFESSGEIRVLNVDDSSLTRLTFEGGTQPTWSPDGARIAFVSHRDGSNQVYVMEADGSDATQLTFEGGEHPAWSPDGTHIAFASMRGGSEEIYVMDVEGADIKQLTNTGGTEPCWSPDGTLITFVSHGELFTMSADGSNRSVLPIQDSSNCRPTDVHLPAWSPDGTRLAFSSHPACVEGTGISIYVMNADGSNVELIGKLADDAPTWSPDGTRIAFATASGISVMNADGSDRVNLTTNSYQDLFPAWSP